jgi:hypothetical protein
VSLPVAVARERIVALEQAMQAAPEAAQAWQQTDHHFAPGLYARVLYVAAGTVFTGALHRTRHFYSLMQGRVSVVDSHGNRQEIEAPHLGITEPGTKRAVYVHEDAIWVNYHPTDKTDPDEIIAEITAESFEQFDAGAA